MPTTDTSGVNAINLQVKAEDQIAIDLANGTYEQNLAADSKYYLWHGQFQTIPLGMDGNPEQFAAQLRLALPQVNTLRLPFNAFSFNPDGSLHEQYERFLVAAAAEGFQIIFVYSDGDAQRYGSGTEATSDQIYDALDGEIYARMEAAWIDLLNWTNAHPDVAQAVYGYEIVNEPAAYDRGVDHAASGEAEAEMARFAELYASHVASISDLIQSQAEGHILVGGWGYSARFQELADVVIDGVSALDTIRAAVGEGLVWSSHFYPGWHGTQSVESPEDVAAAFTSLYASLGDDAILITETNLYGAAVYDYDSATPYILQFARAAEWLADNGIGTSWFPGAETGGSNLVVIDPDGTLRFLHQDSYAAAMNAYSLGEDPVEHSGDEILNATLVAAQLRNEPNDPTLAPDTSFDPVGYLGFAFGYGGNDALLGSDLANNFLYGGEGNDTLTGSVNDDFLYGQDGDDQLVAGDGHDKLFGGRGNDTLQAGGGYDLLEGGSGTDHFILTDGGTTIVTDFDPTIGETFTFGGLYASFDDILARAEIVALNGTAADDAIIHHDNGATTTFLDIGTYFTTPDNSPTGTPGVFDGTARDDRIEAGSIDRDAEVFGVDTFVVHGGGGNDLIIGDNASEELHGDAGDDQIGGGRGNDTIYGGAGNDVLAGQKGNNEIYGGEGDDTLNTGSHSSLLDGGNGNDVLLAHFGNGATHRMIGGDGFDSFEIPFLNPDRAAHAIIEDFDPLSDRLRIEDSTIKFDALPAGFTAADTADGLLLTLGASGSTVLLNGVTLDQMLAAPDGVVSGSEADDVIDVSFADAQGDSLGSSNPFLDFSVEAGGGNDFILATNRAELLLGGAGNDTIFAEAGDDTIDAGDGDDIVYGRSGNNTIFGGAGNDRLIAGYHDSWMDGGDGNDVLEVVATKNSEFVLTGGEGSDVFDLIGDSAGNTTCVTVQDFAAGTDRLKIDGIAIDISGSDASVQRVETPDGVEISLIAGGAVFVLAGLTLADLGSANSSDGIVTIDGTELGDVIDAGFVDAQGHSVSIWDDIVQAGGGDDVVDPGEGSDQVFGGGGNDLIQLGTGNDTAYGGDGDDVIYGERGNNTILGEAGNDQLYSGRNSSVTDGGAGDDILNIEIARADQIVTGGTGADWFVLSGTLPDQMTHSVVTDFSLAEDALQIGGQDINLQFLPENITGADQADGYLLTLDNGSTVLFAGLSFTPLEEAPEEIAVEGTQAADTISIGYTDADGTSVTSANDIIYGLGGNDTIQADAGNDTLHGGSGDDLMYLDAGNDLAFGGVGNDTIYGQKGNNEIYGNAGADVIHSGRHASVLDGGEGNDQLIADIGRAGHVLTGGLGADSFEFNTVRAGKTSNSTITDFNYAEDVLVIAGSQIDLNALPTDYVGMQTGDGLLLDLGDGSTILFERVAVVIDFAEQSGNSL